MKGTEIPVEIEDSIIKGTEIPIEIKGRITALNILE